MIGEILKGRFLGDSEAWLVLNDEQGFDWIIG